ncbi:MAG TPA: cold shock domain-containing protein [Rubrobacter sp.]|nr:cold shock domain-containing protein [Rubrobacter sp.]
MPRGTFRWFDDARSYGCISPNDGGEDIFVRNTGISGEGFETIDEGDEVSLQVTLVRKGMQACDVSEVLAAAWGRRPRSGVLS